MIDMSNIENELSQKVQALGSDTIMGEMANVATDEANAQLKDLKEAVEASQEATNVVTGNMPIMPQYLPVTRPIVRDYAKIGRNDPCPCGSGKKYKKCCLDSGKYETTHEE